MAVEYELRILNRAGALQKLITGEQYRALTYTKRVNAPGNLIFDLNGGHDAVALLDLDWQVEVRRRDSTQSIAWYTDFYGFWRYSTRSADNDGLTTYRAHCVGQMDYLSRAIVAWPAETNNRSSFGPTAAETIAHNIVEYNCTTDATMGNGRDRTVGSWKSYVTEEVDGAAGNVKPYKCARKNVLVALQEVATIGGGDFDLVKIGAQAWEYRWLEGQLGTDRSASVTFSMKHGNMANPSLSTNNQTEKTVAIVGGMGEEDARPIVTRTGTNHNTDWNDREVFYPASQYDTTAGLNSVGDRYLAEREARDELLFDVLQVPASLYGQHYFLGDLVSAYFADATITKKIWGVTVSVTPNSQTPDMVKIVTGAPYA